MAQAKPDAGAAAAAVDPGQIMSAHFADRPFAEHGSRWNACWERGQTGWDRGQHSAALLEVLTRGVPRPDGNEDAGGSNGREALYTAEKLFPGHPSSSGSGGSGGERKRGRMRALVPGCGRGYDVLLLSSLGYDVIGVDLSPVGIQRAREHAEERRRDGSYPLASSGNTTGASVEPGTFTFVEGDFFKDDWLEQVSGSDGDGDGKAKEFDLIFDYTFGCALPPQARPLWAGRLSSLLAREGGRLVCLEFPSAKSPDEPGPPWAMPPHVYVEYLTNASGDGARAADSQHGLRRLVHGKPATTHAAGMQDGEVVDCISVWSH
ncbi:S-adenosyl-L-methionine-dependent methyltransferase [Microdochium bolleyi]|uniref:S-adenosyl-L-methionine-dependent methyltransferase n=1 Tax=Microdochium bolleyi TaxID=196109 RepID=A0A136IRQ7_9PEZI|nr:S-adenosyl-L-methionine-dependent methyltransferase [Microdochium bolleyi]